MVLPLPKTVWQLLIQLNIHSPNGLAIQFLGIFPGKIKTYIHKNMYLNIYNDFICNNQKLEITQMFVNKRMNKQTVTYSYNGILINSQTEKTH